MKKTWVVAVLAMAPLTLAARVGQNGTLQVIPTPYNPGHAPVRIIAAWGPDARVPNVAHSNHPLILDISDTVPYPPGASAEAIVTPVEGLKLTHLGFDHKVDTYCTVGSPRWDVETTDGSVYAFGCASGVRQVDLPATGWERITFSCSDVQVLTGPPGSCPLGSAQTVARVQVVHDESGSTALDNLEVNWVTMRRSDSAR
jgi:hypothetical protein